MQRRQLSHAKFTVGWVCALPCELEAAEMVLDEIYENLPHNRNDTNIYTLGRVKHHNVVLACMPAGRMGTTSAAVVVTQMNRTFQAVRFVLMVGIGGGVPSKETNIRLGDVVVSQPNKDHGGVIQYDIGKTTPNGCEPLGFLNTPPTILLHAIAVLRARDFGVRSGFRAHIPQSKEQEIPIEDMPRIHYGTIASGNQVIKDAKTRDKISSLFGGVLCFEMEAAGLMNSFPCLVIRGISDYADAHKDKKWQPYASRTAAAYAKNLLSVIPPTELSNTQTIDEAMIRGQLKINLLGLLTVPG